MRRLKLAVFWAARAIGLFSLARRLTRRHLKILCYHGFSLDDEHRFRPKLFMRAETFAQRLAKLKRQGYRVLRLDDAVRQLYEGSLPDDAVVLTIDDGFHGVHRLAAPLLRSAGLPATVYVTTYYVQQANPVFRLAVQYLFWKSPHRQLQLQGLPWTADRVLDFSHADAVDEVAWDCVQYGEGQCTEPERVALCQSLGELLGVDYAALVTARQLHLMTPDELRTLGDSGLDVELHTHRHVFPDDEQARAEREILDNRHALASILPNFSGRHFCYPSGLWAPGQAPWLDGLGVLSSTTCLPGLNTPDTPRHAMRRFLDGENIHPLEFEAALSGFTDLLRRAQ